MFQQDQTEDNIKNSAPFFAGKENKSKKKKKSY